MEYRTVVVVYEMESMSPQRSTVVWRKKQIKEVLCFTGTHGDVWADVSMAYQVRKNDASCEATSIFLLHLKIMQA